MNIHSISIVPIELFTIKIAKKLENDLILRKILFECSEPVQEVFQEIAPIGARIHKVSELYGNNIYIAFSESSLCLYYENILENIDLTLGVVYDLLNSRKRTHCDVINNDLGSPIKNIIDTIKIFTDKAIYKVNINYVFSFYLIKTDKLEIDKNKTYFKILAEPSFIDLDDMISSQSKLIAFNDAKLDPVKLSSIRDVDLFGSVETYVTWATIVSIIYDPKDFISTKNLLISLELRLQIIWNRCYSLSLFIDELLDGKFRTLNIDEIYWSFARTLDDARAVLSSTFSTRASKLFEEMILTSKVAGEIDRLNLKVNLLEKFIENRARKENLKYQKAFQVLLFVTALASLVQIAIPIPIMENQQLSWLIISLVSLLGLFIILRSK